MSSSSKTHRSNLSNWSNLMPEILDLIVQRLDPQDRAASRMVCRSWRAVAKNYSSPILADPIRLLIPRQTLDFCFFSVLDRAFKGPKGFPDWRCCGHLDGWFAMVSDEAFKVALVDVVHNSWIFLPCRFRLMRKFADGLLSSVTKVVLSAAPTDEDCVVIALGKSSAIAVCRPRGDRWVMVESTDEAYEDLAVYKRRLYALHFSGGLTVYSLESFPRIVRDVVLDSGQLKNLYGQRHLDAGIMSRFLVESLGELLLVAYRYSVAGRCRGGDRELEFRVFVLCDDGWIPLTSLGDQALFVSRVCSVSVLVEDGLRSPNLKQNHVYFANKLLNQTVGLMGVFSMRDFSVSRIPIHTKHFVDCEPVWIKSFLV